jgi:hypothetical protein
MLDNSDYAKEMLREGRQADREDKERLELLKLLVRHPGWKIYLDLVTTHKQELADVLLAPARSVDEMVFLEGKKGEMRGILYAESALASTIAGLQQLVATDEE